MGHTDHLFASRADDPLGRVVGEADDPGVVDNDDAHRRGRKDARQKGPFARQFGLRRDDRLVLVASHQHRTNDIGHRLQKIYLARQKGVGPVHPVKAHKAISRPLQAHRHQQD